MLLKASRASDLLTKEALVGKALGMLSKPALGLAGRVGRFALKRPHIPAAAATAGVVAASAVNPKEVAEKLRQSAAQV